jgi:uncharacterized protein YciI/uncharacterized damage-inducible protein DinB
MHYVLLYEVADDYVTRRAPFRGAHLKQVHDAHRRGEIVLAGALAEPVAGNINGAMLVFRDASAAERFAASDPYVLNGAVRSWKIRHWNTVLGDGAILPHVDDSASQAAAEIPGRPEPNEHAAYASAYVDLVEGGDILRAFTVQQADVLTYLRPLSEEAGQSTYAPGKWTVKQVLGHITDTERIFTYRALCLARGESKPLPGFDQDEYIQSADFNACSLASLLEEFRAVRESTLSLYWNLPADAWQRRGTVNDYSATVRGLAFTSAGHERHHMKILRERYLGFES